MVRAEISVWNVTYIPVTYKPKIDGQTFWLILLALNIRANERETVTYKHVTYKPKGVYSRKYKFVSIGSSTNRKSKTF